jgi:limonene-1,2-epoxide hydrolase
MSPEEVTLREVFRLWENGLPGMLESFTTHCTPDVRWWNAARGAIVGVEECLAGLRMLVDVVGFTGVEVRVRSMVTAGTTAYVEREDALFRPDGSLIVAPPVFGVVEFENGRITEWRDYAADWLGEFLPSER